MSGDASLLRTLAEAVAAVLVVVGLLTASVATLGMLRLPSFMARLHAAGKTAPMAVVSFLFAGFLLGDPGLAARALVVAAFLLLSTPVSSQVMARWEVRRSARNGGEPGEDTGPGRT